MRPADVFHRLGEHYFLGNVIPIDIKKAEEYFLMASELGSSLSKIQLARAYFTGNVQNISRDTKRAKELAFSALSLGSKEALAFLAECCGSNNFLSEEESLEIINLFLAYAETNNSPVFTVQAYALKIKKARSDEEKNNLFEEAFLYFQASFSGLCALEKERVLLIFMRIFLHHQSILASDENQERRVFIEEQFFELENDIRKGEILGLAAQYFFSQNGLLKAFELMQRAILLGFADSDGIMKLFGKVINKLQKQKKIEARQKKQEEDAEKKARREEQKRIRKKQKISALAESRMSQKSQFTGQSWEIIFINDEVKTDYENLLNDDASNLSRLMESIFEARPWQTLGDGKPEVLKHKFFGLHGCISRRINQFDRLVYHVEPGRILILSAKDHYKKL